MHYKSRILVVLALVVILMMAIVLPAMAGSAGSVFSDAVNGLLALTTLVGFIAAFFQRSAKGKIKTAAEKAAEAALKTQQILAKIEPNRIRQVEDVLSGAAGRQIVAVEVIQELNDKHDWGFADEQIEAVISVVSPLCAQLRIPLR